MRNDELDLEGADLETKTIDTLVKFGKGAVGIVPFVGPLMSEILFSKVPGLRQERVVKFVQILEERLTSLEDEKRIKLLSSATNIDFIEAATYSASKAVSEVKIEAIANLVSNGLSIDEIEAVRRKRLLLILDQIDDDAFLLLKAYGDSYSAGGGDAWDQVRRPKPKSMDSSQIEIDESNLFDAGRAQLLRFGLLTEKMKLKDKAPIFDHMKKKFKTTIEISQLGRLLLREVGQPAPFDDRSR